MFELVGEALGIEGGARVVIGWTVAGFFLAFAVTRLPGMALTGLRNYRQLRYELKHAPKQGRPTDTGVIRQP